MSESKLPDLTKVRDCWREAIALILDESNEDNKTHVDDGHGNSARAENYPSE